MSMIPVATNEFEKFGLVLCILCPPPWITEYGGRIPGALTRETALEAVAVIPKIAVALN
jgi:hypothetical protein